MRKFLKTHGEWIIPAVLYVLIATVLMPTYAHWVEMEHMQVAQR